MAVDQGWTGDAGGQLAGGADRATLAPTGHPDVDAALDGLGAVVDLPPHEQVELYGEVHRSLQDTLRGIATN